MVSPERERAQRFAVWATAMLEIVRDQARDTLGQNRLVYTLDEIAALQSIANRSNEAMLWAYKLEDSLKED